MGFFSRIMGGFLLGSSLLFPYIASARGWGLSSERNPKIVSEMQQRCPARMRTLTGHCRSGYRSYYAGRSLYGGGPRYGK